MTILTCDMIFVNMPFLSHIGKDFPDPKIISYHWNLIFNPVGKITNQVNSLSIRCPNTEGIAMLSI
ncbi:Uncharacterised protein [Streptococcus pneumoniae]|nr:Uncharacterised protein [Streptococcus pneumoniae]